MAFSVFRSLLFALILITAVVSQTFAYEVAQVCAKYLNSNKAYTVEAQVYDGGDLNRRTNSFNYDYFSPYVVIFWVQGQATVIDNGPIIGETIGPFGARGTDRQGRPWEVREGHLFCF